MGSLRLPVQMTGIRAKLTVIVCLAGVGFALVGLSGAVGDLEEVRSYQLDDRWAGGTQWGIDIGFLEWAGSQIEDEDEFLVVNGERNVALDLWSTYQLYPATRTTDPDRADWAIIYGTTDEESGLDPESFGDVRGYSDRLYLLKRTRWPAGEGESDGP